MRQSDGMARGASTRRRRGRLRIGTSGWQYDHWRGRFYPSGLAERAWLAWYAERFDTVEVNSTFYRLPEAAVFDRWREAVPAGFCFALKLSRFASHLKHLADPAEALGTFLERADRLGAHLGPILVQLPPRWAPNVERLGRFLAEAPRAQRFAIELRDAFAPRNAADLRRYVQRASR
jgi:uncharacterized protein YecE (DUF72 family)